MAGTRTRPPTQGEVAAEWYDREQRTAPHEQPARKRDLEWAAVLERRDALVRSGAVGVATGWQVSKGLRLPVQPLHPQTMQPVGEPLLDPKTVLEHWDLHRDHGVGIRLGPVQNGRMSLVGLRAAAWSSWRSWVREHATVERLRPWSDEDLSRETVERDLKPLGGPTIVRWLGPAGPPMWATAVTRGDKQLRLAGEQLRRSTVGEDRGGWLLWSAGPVDGRLPVVKGHELAAGLDVLDRAPTSSRYGAEAGTARSSRTAASGNRT